MFENYESTHLPSVKEPTRAIEAFKEKFDGKVHVVSAEDSIDEIPIEKDIGNLIIVSLPSSNGADKQKALRKSGMCLAWNNMHFCFWNYTFV